MDFPCWVSKMCREDLCIYAANIINTMIKTKQCPTLWKMAEMHPLTKVLHPKIYKGFRPISLLWHMVKVAESAFLKLYKYEVVPTIKPHQYAYLSSLGAVDALVKMVDDWTLMLDDKNTVGEQVILKDFSKLLAVKIHPGIVKLCEKFLCTWIHITECSM